ncbi:MAG: hypothetical protein IKQ71_09385 [Lachnospiraceae bacterium]|nr:hypothetical protein [Lachnospiraceae bacterium]
MLTIETEAQMTEAAAKEIVNVTTQIKTLLKTPEKKLTDYFKFCPCSMIFCAVMTVFCVFYILKFGGDPLIYVCLGVMLLTFVLALVMYRSVNRYKKLLIDKSGKVTVTFDEEGIDYDNHADRKLKLSWGGTAFIRVLKECIYVTPKDITSVMICLKKDYAESVLRFVNENNIDVRIIK